MRKAEPETTVVAGLVTTAIEIINTGRQTAHAELEGSSPKQENTYIEDQITI